jgi:hypothetical protein
MQMGFKGFLGVLGVLMGSVSAFCDWQLWLIEQDFVKFGKKEVYEKYKKEMLGENATFAMQDEDASQYIYLFPVGDYKDLSDSMQGCDGSDNRIAFLSTLNFTIQSLHRYLPRCSYIPKGKESLLAYPNIVYYLFGVVPGNDAVFEAQLLKIAGDQAKNGGTCFRSWKILMGSDVPKYLVAVFASDEAQAEGLEFVPTSLKGLLRSQKQGSAVLRRDLSINNP